MYKNCLDNGLRRKYCVRQTRLARLMLRPHLSSMSRRSASGHQSEQYRIERMVAAGRQWISEDQAHQDLVDGCAAWEAGELRYTHWWRWHATPTGLQAERLMIRRPA